MKLTGNLGRQFSDLMAYIVLPLGCALLPVKWTERLLRRCAGRGWILKTRSRQASDTAARLMYLADPAAWRQKWRLVELTEARDVWFILLGRQEALLERVQIEGEPPVPGDGQALIGLHWGPSVLALAAFRRLGLKPRFVYRHVESDIRRQAPFQYLYLRLVVRVIDRCCGGGAITVPGAKAELATALEGPETPVLLMDAPPVRDRRVLMVNLLERRAPISADGIELLANRHARCTFFAMSLDIDNEGKQLVFTESVSTDDPRELASMIAAHFNRFVLHDSSQWRLWHAARQLFNLDLDA